MSCHCNKERRVGRSLCPGTATGLGSGNIERLLSCLQVLASSGRKRKLSVYDWCTGAYDSAEARSAHTMSPTFPYCTHGHAVSATNIRMTCQQCNVLLDWPVSWRKDVLSESDYNPCRVIFLWKLH